MATEEQKIVSSESLGFKEREKIENPAELLQNSINGLDKFGGFQLLKGLIKGAAEKLGYSLNFSRHISQKFSP